MPEEHTIITKFPHPVLTKLNGKPSAEGIRVIKRELFANASSVGTTLGGGNYGFLGLIMDPVAYAALPHTVPFVVPVHPGDHPGHAPHATGNQITETNRVYLQTETRYKEFLMVHTSLKNQFYQAVGASYYNQLADDVFGFTYVTIGTLFNHLETTYGTIQPEELEANITKLATDWDPTTAIEDLWKRVLDCQRFARAGREVIPETQVVRKLIIIFERTGLFGPDLHLWKYRPVVEHTYANLQTAFNLANEQHFKSMTSGNGGFANQATTPPATTVTPPVTMTPGTTIVNGAPLYYCWSHGLSPVAAHTSATCNHPREDHQVGATIENMMGGSNRFRLPRPDQS